MFDKIEVISLFNFLMVSYDDCNPLGKYFKNVD